MTTWMAAMRDFLLDICFVLLMIVGAIVLMITLIMGGAAGAMHLFDNEFLRLITCLMVVFGGMGAGGGDGAVGVLFGWLLGGVLALGGVQLLSSDPWTAFFGVLAFLLGKRR